MLVAAALVPLLHLLSLTVANYYDVPYPTTWSL